MANKKEVAKAQQGLEALPEDLQAQMDEMDDGADADITRILKLDGGITLRVGEDETSLGQDVDILILGMMPLGRGCFEGAYDPKNVSTPTCFSLDARTPHELAKPPQVIDRSSGNLVPASSCKGKTGNCVGMIGENTCGWKRHVVCVLRDNISVSGLISFPIPSAALFNKGDVKNNPDPENRVGLEMYYKKVKALPTANGKPVKMFQVVTSVKWHKQNERGETFTFSCINPEDGSIQGSHPTECIEAMKVMRTDEYQAMLGRYDDYLIEGAKRKIAEAEEAANPATDAPEPSTDDLADLAD